MQGKVRSMEPPYSPPCHMLVGLDSEGIAAVSYFEELDGPSVVDLCYMAVATRHRGKGGGYAYELAIRTLEEIETLALNEEVGLVDVIALVDEHNHPSQGLCRRLGLVHSGMEADHLQQWSLTFAIGDAPIDTD